MLIHSDSFDLSNTTSQYDFTGSFVAISPVAARTGVNGVNQDPGGLGKNFGNLAQYIVGFAFQIPSSLGAAILLQFFDTSTAQTSITMDTFGRILVRTGNSGGTIIGTASTAITPFAWHYIEVAVTINNSTGAAQVWLDGNSVINVTSVNTRGGTTNNYANQVCLGALTGSSATVWMDDYYILDPTTGANTTRLGDVKINALLPTGNGTQNNYTQVAASFANSHAYTLGNQLIDTNGALQRCTTAGTSASSGTPTWSTTVGGTTTSSGATFTLIQKATLSNFNFVNEYPPDDNNSYLLDSTVNDEDRYTYAALPNSNTVFAVNVKLRAEKDDVGNRSIRAVALSGGTQGTNGTDFALSNGVYNYFEGIIETDPNTSAQWTAAAVNAAEFGIKTTL